MNVRSFFLYIFILITAIARAQDKPNIVLFFIDDWAWNGTSVQMDDEGFNSYIPSLMRMPNLEQLASEGMIFSHAYSGAPQCSPSRVALQTGQSSPRNGFTVYMNDGGEDYYDLNKNYSQFPVVPNVSDMTIDPDATTIPEALMPHGYTSAHIGKWHMRGDPDDEGYIMNSGPTTNNEGNENIQGDPKRMFSITDSAVFFIEEQVDAGKPFYIQLSHYAMHEGRECLDETRAKYQAKKELQDYYKLKGETASTINYKSDPATWLGMAEDLDGRIGVVLDKLKELGIYENTYIIVTADNGYREDFYEDLFRRPQPLHGAKWWLWQGGLRVMMLARGPDIPAGSVCDENVVNYDFLPTFVEWAGGDPQTELTDIDGISLASVMRGEPVGPSFSNRTLYFHYPHYRTSMPMSVAISGEKKVVHFYERPDIPMYFNIGNDIAETKNIAESDPEGHDALFNNMMQYLEDVGARIPLYPNPNYDSLAYASAKEYEKRVMWGPFLGERKLEEDEYISSVERLCQDLNALNRSTITTDENSALIYWKDQTYKENDAMPGTSGKPVFPSSRLFESGLSGIDFGNANASVELFNAEKADSLMDFSGVASDRQGFALKLIFNPNDLKDEWCYLVGNSVTPGNPNSFGIRFNGTGMIEAYLGGKSIQTSKPIAGNISTALSVNYTVASSTFQLYTTLGDTLSVQVPKGDFTNLSSIYLGGIDNESGGFYNGLIGEVKVYDIPLDSMQFIDETNELLENWTTPAEQVLLQHLDASVEESLETDDAGLLSKWSDLSNNGYDATPQSGVLYFPSYSVSATGLKGVDFGPERNILELFTSNESDNFLDFTGAAAKNSGFTVFLAFKIDSIIDNQNDIIGNSTSVSDINGFGMRFDSDGRPRAYVGGEKIILTNVLAKGESVVYALKYDKSAQKLEFWNSSTGTSESISLVPGDFSNNSSFTLGSCGGNTRFFVGMVGEIKVYNYSLSETDYIEQYTFLTDKWKNGLPSEVSWTKNPVSKSDAVEDLPYSDSILSTEINNPKNKKITFSKVSGPAWLEVAENGLLTGTPAEADLGENTFTVDLVYDQGSHSQTTLVIQVLHNVTWVMDPFIKSDAIADSVYLDSITSSDINNPDNIVLQYNKLSGPHWLNVSDQGMLTGTPGQEDLGTNTFNIGVTYKESTMSQASMTLEVMSGTLVNSELYLQSGLYPNPVSSILQIESTYTGHYKVYDLSGGLLLENDFSGIINVSSLQKGMYLLKVNDKVMRFIKN